MNKGQGDLYPSRQTSKAGFIGRLDPVIYQDWTPQAPISREQYDAYNDNGFLVLHDVFSSKELQKLQAEAAELHAGARPLEDETLIREPGAGAVRSIFHLHRQSRIFARLAADRRIAEIAQFILNDKVYLHQSRLNYKPGFMGKDFFWHSDFETWHTEDGMPHMRALSASVLMTDNTAVNGPTMFMVGSHIQFVRCIGETPEEHYKQSLKRQQYGIPDELSLAELAQGGIETPIGPAGTIVLFDCNVMHGSNSNISPAPRSNAFFVYNALSNQLKKPFGATQPRPEFIAARKHIDVIEPQEGSILKLAA